MALERRALPLGLVLLLLLATSGCGKSNDTVKPGGDGGVGYHVTIRETSYGIPHILADDVPSAVAGLGYVGARDYGCILLDQIVRVRSERAKYFGPGDKNANVDSDFAMLALGIHDCGDARASDPRLDLARDPIDGYVAGFNYYLAHEKLSALCDGKDWVRPLTGRGSLRVLLLARAARERRPAVRCRRDGRSRRGRRKRPRRSAPAELAGSRRTRRSAATAGRSARTRARAAKGMLLANPHFPWEGNRKLLREPDHRARRA